MPQGEKYGNLPTPYASSPNCEWLLQEMIGLNLFISTTWEQQNISPPV